MNKIVKRIVYLSQKIHRDFDNNQIAEYQEDLNHLVENLKRNQAEEIVSIAYENWVEGVCDGIVYLNLDTEEFDGKSWRSNTRPAPDYNVIELYRLNYNWKNNNVWENPNELITDEEYDKLVDKYGESDVDYANAKQLESIGVDFDERIKEFLVFQIENN